MYRISADKTQAILGRGTAPRKGSRFNRLILKPFFIVTTSLLVSVCGSISCHAWQVSMDFGFYWKYYYLSSLGRNHLFGPHDVDATGFHQNNVNFWGGIRDFDNGMYSGQCSVQTQYMEIYPQLKANEAVTFRAKLRIGEWNDPLASEYRPNSSRPGTNVAFSEIQVTQAWLTAQTPWGIVAVGKRPFSFGIGTWLSGSDNTTLESLSLAAPYGPFRFIAGFYPSRHLTELYDDPAIAPIGQQMSPNGDDTTNLRAPETYAAIVYSNGPFEFGLFYEFLDWEVRPETFRPGLVQDQIIPRDWHADWGVCYVKYGNGRFFFNAEVDYFISTVRNRRNATGVSSISGSSFVAGVGLGSVFQTTHTEMWRAAVELGAAIGPAKVTAMWAWIPGFDRRHGVYIDRQPNAFWISEPVQALGAVWRPPGMVTAHPDFSNTGFFLPYSYLLAYQYSGGVGTNTGGPFTTRNRDGQLVDANVYAARLDYSLAANLNLWASFLWAERVSHGYGWGHLAPTVGVWTVQFANRGLPTQPTPAIPNNFLGYEIGIGLDWQLLGSLRLNIRGAFWQPGDWWKFACVSKNNFFWTTPNHSPWGNWGINPNRAIDPITGVQVTLASEF